jgi:hypothetical protein
MATVETSQPKNQQNAADDASPSTTAPGVGTGDDEKVQSPVSNEDWEYSSQNPYNWSTQSKVLQVLMMASAAFTT